MKNYLYHRIARQAMLLSSSVGTFNVPIELNNKIYIDRKKYVYIYISQNSKTYHYLVKIGPSLFQQN